MILDTYAWVEYFLGSPKGRVVKDLLEKGAYTPDVVLAEIARKYLREGFSREEVVKRLRFMEFKSIVVSVDSSVALRAAEIYFELLEKARRERLRTPSLVDAVVLAMARILGTKLVTGDRLFKGLRDVVYIGD